jgi:threonine/homoserine/homoserine lactone efflux protein
LTVPLKLWSHSYVNIIQSALPDLALPFLVVVAVLTITPGPDMALVLKNGARGGGPAAWWTGLGCCAGIAVHAFAAVAGLSAILAASATVFGIVKLAGAGYLIWLGVSSWWHSFRRETPSQSVADQASAATTPARAFQQGLLSNLLNPKIVLIFLTLLPQFVAPDEPRVLTLAELAAIFLLSALLWWRLFSLLVSALGRALSREKVRKAFDRVTGTVLGAFGIAMVVESS